MKAMSELNSGTYFVDSSSMSIKAPPIKKVFKFALNRGFNPKIYLLPLSSSVLSSK